MMRITEIVLQAVTKRALSSFANTSILWSIVTCSVSTIHIAKINISLAGYCHPEEDRLLEIDNT